MQLKAKYFFISFSNWTIFQIKTPFRRKHFFFLRELIFSPKIIKSLRKNIFFSIIDKKCIFTCIFTNSKIHNPEFMQQEFQQQLMIQLSISICLLSIVFARDAPLLHPSYQQYFDESYKLDHNYTINGQVYYDAENSRGRIDRADGRFDVFCGTVMPQVVTPCTSLIVEGKLYLYFPRKKTCCFCCDEEHGCGVTPRDYFVGSEYLGQEKLVDTMYDKWEKIVKGVSVLFYTTADDRSIPRRIVEGTGHIYDYNVLTFKNTTFPDSVFEFPSYCKNAPSCPLSSNCGKLRQGMLGEE